MSLQLSLNQIASIATTYNQGRLDYALSEVSTYANLALQQVAAVDQFRSLESTYNFSMTSGTTSVSLPSDFYAMTSVSVSSGSYQAWNRRMYPAQPADLDSYGTYPGVPRYYTIYASQFKIAPMSDSTYSGVAYYQTKVPNLMASGDTPALEDRYHYAVALKTAEMLSAARNDVVQEALNHQRYMDYMSQLPNDRALRERDKMSGVRLAKWRGGYRP